MVTQVLQEQRGESSRFGVTAARCTLLVTVSDNTSAIEEKTLPWFTALIIQSAETSLTVCLTVQTKQVWKWLFLIKVQDSEQDGLKPINFFCNRDFRGSYKLISWLILQSCCIIAQTTPRTSVAGCLGYLFPTIINSMESHDQICYFYKELFALVRSFKSLFLATRVHASHFNCKGDLIQLSTCSTLTFVSHSVTLNSHTPHLNVEKKKHKPAICEVLLSRYWWVHSSQEECTMCWPLQARGGTKSPYNHS